MTSRQTKEPSPPGRPRYRSIIRVDTAKPYRMDQIHPAARPRDEKEPEPVDKFEWAPGPRACTDPHGPNGPVYWCASCNRRVPHERQSFCTRHEAQRAKHMRKRREQRDAPVPIPQPTLTELVRRKRELEDSWRAVQEARDPGIRAAATARHTQAIASLTTHITEHLDTPR